MSRILLSAACLYLVFLGAYEHYVQNGYVVWCFVLSHESRILLAICFSVILQLRIGIHSRYSSADALTARG